MSTSRHPTIVITGATSGIGEVTARELARQGVHVVLLARNAARAEAARAENGRRLWELSEELTGLRYLN